jgi:8-oxo-dGTP pyrophosphatase MutT (NUDIX family)
MEMKSNNKKYRKAVFGVAYCKDNKRNVEYIILKRKKHWVGWEFPKGKIEKNETKKDAARREVHEETGLKVLKIKKFHEKGSYHYSKRLADRPGLIGQTYHLFAVEVKKGKVKLGKIEHSKYKWVSFKEAQKKLKWPNQKKCLKIVDKWLLKKN